MPRNVVWPETNGFPSPPMDGMQQLKDSTADDIWCSVAMLCVVCNGTFSLQDRNNLTTTSLKNPHTHLHIYAEPVTKPESNQLW